jgi:hypothetical protein
MYLHSGNEPKFSVTLDISVGADLYDFPDYKLFALNKGEGIPFLNLSL